MKFTPFCIIDIETTGLAPKRHSVLEIAALCVDEKLECRSEFGQTIKPHEDSVWDKAVMEMHLRNGLWREAETCGKSLSAVQAVFEQWQLTYFSDPHIVYAGKNVGKFDVPFLAAHGFNLRTSHRSLDVGSVFWPREGRMCSMYELASKYLPKCWHKQTHRAIDDCYMALHLLQVAIGEMS